MTHPAFEHLRTESVPSLNIDVAEYRHKATGARHFHLASEDNNNAFLVAFLTVPQDSSGVAHILEHTSLCGSEKYPVRDPFFMMIRRSLNTFMNAFTSSDWTAYPFASQNRKDFNNLLGVYLDAVFFPRLDPLDFSQEGHRVEFEAPEDPDSELVFKGVVFNEMKGAMSSPTSRLWQLLHENIFTTTTYHHNSGGEPADIPDLTYEQLKSFHASHYHPSNAVFMTYGDMPVDAHQQRFEDEALSRFTAEAIDHSIPDEVRFGAPVQAEAPYPVEPGDDVAGKTHIVIGWLLGKSANLDDILPAHLLSGVLLDNSASPLRQALETTDLASAPSELCGLDDSTREATFMCGVEGSDPDKADAVEALVLDVLTEVAKHGVPQQTVESVLHQLELNQREIKGGSFPYGLRLMVNALSPTLHGGDPVAVLNIDPSLEKLRTAIKDPHYIRQLASDLLENPHRVRVVMTPDPVMNERLAAAERERLAAMKQQLKAEDRERITQLAKELEARQNSEEDPSVLPKVELADVPKTIPIPSGSDETVAGLDAGVYEAGTNGLVYLKIVSELPDLAPELLDLLPLYCDLLTEVGAGDDDYLTLQARQAAVSGGIGASTGVRSHIDDLDSLRGFVTLSGKGLVDRYADMAALLSDVYLSARFDETARLRDVLAQIRAHQEMSITGHGHGLAMTAAAAGMGPVASLSHRWSGLAGIKAIKQLDDAVADDAAMAALQEQLQAIHEAVHATSRRLFVACEPQRRDEVVAGLETALGALSSTSAAPTMHVSADRHRVTQGWAVNTQINFCAKAYATVPAEHHDAPALSVLGRFLTNGFLHRAVREQGGAYGGGASHDSDSGAFRFYSYRDPRIAGTLTDFDASVRWLLDNKHGYDALEEAILGVVSAIDRPDSPAGEASRTFFGKLHGRSAEQRLAYRSRVLDVSVEDLQRVGAQYLQPEQASQAVISDQGTLDDVSAELGLDVIKL